MKYRVFMSESKNTLFFDMLDNGENIWDKIRYRLIIDGYGLDIIEDVDYEIIAKKN